LIGTVKYEEAGELVGGTFAVTDGGLIGTTTYDEDGTLTVGTFEVHDDGAP